MAQQSSTEASTAAAGPEAARLLRIVEGFAAELHPQLSGFAPVTIDSSLDRELGIDSLGRVELLARVEREFDCALPEQVLAAAETPRDLLRAVLSDTSRPVPAGIVAREQEAATPAAAGELPYAAQTLVEVLEWHAASHPDRIHIRLYSDQDEGEVISYGALWQGALQIAEGLKGLGLGFQESVLIMLPTGREYFVSFFGTLLAGGVPVPIYPPGRPKQIEEHLRRHAAIADNCQAVLMISFPEATQFARLLRLAAPRLRRVVTVAELLAEATGRPEQPRPALKPSDVAFLQYTSGSTGLPKGVVLTHANLLANIRAMGRMMQVSSSDVFVSWLPLYHDMGLIGAWLGSLHFACPLVIMSPLAFLARPLRWLQAIHRFRGTLSAAPNFAYELCLRRIEESDLTGLDLSSWRLAFNGAEAVSPATIERFIERFSACGFRTQAMKPVYGLAESSVGLAFPRPDESVLIDRIERATFMQAGRAEPSAAQDREALRFVSCGRPLPGHQIRIVDAAGRETPDRRQGRLQFMGPSATSGYFRNPGKSAELFDGKWLNSGDLAYIAEGNVFVTGRSKDMIIRAGRNIFPEELEEAIGGIDGVRRGNVAVFGTIDQDSQTEKLIVLAETRQRQPEALATLKKQINSTVVDLAGNPPDEIVLAPPNTVLKTSSGKIRRSDCRRLYEGGLIGKPARTIRLQMLRLRLSGFRGSLSRAASAVSASAYAAWCWLIFFLAAALIWPLVAVLPVERWRWFAIRQAGRGLARFAGIKFFVHGLENLPPAGEACVLVSNHASYLDGLVLATVLPCGFSFVAKNELLESFVVRLFLRKLGAVFVERFDARKSIADAKELDKKAQAGRSLLFFAEGTFTRMPGLLPFRFGAFEIAAHTGLPVVPVAIRGTRFILRSGSWFPRRSAITVTIGPPLGPAAGSNHQPADTWQTAVELHRQTRAWILRHCGEPDLDYEQPELFAAAREED